MLFRSKNKLIWGKPTSVKPKLIVKDPITPTPTPAPTPTPTPTPSPTVKAFEIPAAPTSFNDVESHVDGVAYWAWKKANLKIAASQSDLGKVNYIIGPNTRPDNPTPNVAIDLTSRFSKNFNQPKEIQIVYASEADIDWGQQQIELLCGKYDCGYDVTEIGRAHV